MQDKIVKGKSVAPPRILVHGLPKIGKTTFAAEAPAPFFLQVEEGADETGKDRSPLLKTYADFQKWLTWLEKEPHDYKTVVVDSVDWLESLIRLDVCAKQGWANVETPGYGKGYAYLEGPWRATLTSLDALRARGIATICLAHSETKRYDSPETEPYDRIGLKLHKGAAGLLTEWADVIGYACQEVRIATADVGFNKEVRRGVTSGRRMLRLQDAPAYVAGNRYGLPATVTLSWDSFLRAFVARYAKDATASAAESAPQNQQNEPTPNAA